MANIESTMNKAIFFTVFFLLGVKKYIRPVTNSPIII